MDLRTRLIEQMKITQRVVMDGLEAIPAWRISTPNTDWLILSRYDQTEPQRQEWVLHHIQRFMACAFAQSFVVSGVAGSASTALVRTDEEAIIGMAASRSDRFAIRQNIFRNPSPQFGKAEHLDPGGIDVAYWKLLPPRREVIAQEQVEALNAIFGIDGELSARWI